MKEIDFLPEWYKSKKRRQVSCRTQYASLGVIFLILMIWNSLTAFSVSRSVSEMVRLASTQIELEERVREFSRIEKEMARLQQKADVLKAFDSRIDIGSVLAELSFLIDEKITLRKLDLNAEKFKDVKGGSRRNLSPRAASRKSGKDSALDSVSGDVQFNIMISGIAPNSRDVAQMIIDLEDSPYFWQVYPSYSRNKQIRRRSQSSVENRYITEFEVGCYLANYQYSDSYQAKNLLPKVIQ